MATTLADPYAKAGPQDPYANATPAPQDPYASASHDGRLSYQQLKDSWVKYGGDPQHADIMAHVFMAESGDGKTYADPNANRDHHTSYTENGKRYYPEGLGQVSTVHGQSNMFDPEANMKYSVGLFKAQGFSPWEASRHGGAGGGWGQYLNAHNHPDNPIAKLPGGGFANVIGATPVPAVHAVTNISTRDNWFTHFTDTMEGIVKYIQGGDQIQVGGQGDLKAASARADALFGGRPSFAGTPEGQFAKQRLSPTLKRVGEAADVLTYGAGNAIARRAGGDKTALSDYWKAVSPLFPKPGKNLANPFEDTMPTPAVIGRQLDALGEYGFNSPSDIAYWASQPGITARMADATPQSAAGKLVQLALGMHADIARLKPSHPYLTGAETTAAQYVNPSYWGAGFAGGALSDAIMGSLGAARMGTFGLGAQKLAGKLADSPLIGNRFTKMGDAFKMPGESWHANFVADMHNAPYDSQDRFTSADTFGGATQEQQVKIVHELQHPGQSFAHEVIGNSTIADRAQAVRSLIEERESHLRAVDPVAADKLMADSYFNQQGAWVSHSSQATDPRFPQGTPSVSGGRDTGPGHPVSTGRVYPTLEDGLAAGEQINPNWIPSGAAAQHDAVLNRYVTTMTALKHLENMHDASGTAGMFNIEYRIKSPQGNILSFGSGPTGLKRAGEYVKQVTPQIVDSKAAHWGWTAQRKAEEQAKYLNPKVSPLWDDMRTLFREKYPRHDFDAADSLGLEALKGRAVENAAVDATIDSHPILSRMQKGGYDHYAVHTQPDEPVGAGEAWLDNLNSIVRQGILSNVWYHGTFNLMPLALNEGVNPIWVARAMAIDPHGSFIPKAWIDEARQYKASAPKFGTALQMDPMTRAKLLTVPYRSLTPTEMAMKALTSASKWNQDVTFGYFEDRLAAVTMHHFKMKGMTPEAAARATRKLFGDYGNMTQKERSMGIMNWHYFYSWMRGQIRYWGNNSLRAPQKIMAPVQGIATANQQQGDEGNQPGSALSLRSAFNAIHYGWGTDSNGNPRYVSLPFPMLRYGTDVMRMGASIASGNPTESSEVGLHLATSSMPPLAGIAVRAGLTAALPAGQPEPWNSLLWDKNAPTSGAMWMQAMSQLGDSYVPSILRGPAEAIASKDPTQAFGALGPYVYSSPNDTQQSKAAYGMQIQLRSILKSAENAGDNGVATEVYDLMQRVENGDPLAAIEAKSKLRALRATLGIPSPRRFTPRL